MRVNEEETMCTLTFNFSGPPRISKGLFRRTKKIISRPYLILCVVSFFFFCFFKISDYFVGLVKWRHMYVTSDDMI